MGFKVSEKLSDTLSKLESDTTNLYNHLIGMKGNVDFTKEHSEEDTITDRIKELLECGSIDLLPMIEMRSDMNGNIFDVYVAYVTADTIICVDFETNNIRIDDRFKNIALIDSKLVLIHEIEEFHER